MVIIYVLQVIYFTWFLVSNQVSRHAIDQHFIDSIDNVFIR